MLSAKAHLTHLHQLPQLSHQCPLLQCKSIFFLDFVSSVFITPGATPGVPSLPSDVLGVGKRTPGVIQDTSPFLLLPTLFTAPPCSPPSAPISSFSAPNRPPLPFLPCFLFLLYQSPLLPLENPSPCHPGARQGDQMLEEGPDLTLPAWLSHPFHRQKTGTESERGRFQSSDSRLPNLDHRASGPGLLKIPESLQTQG